MQIITQNNINNISIKKQQNLMYKLKPKNPFSQYQTHPTIKPQNKKDNKSIRLFLTLQPSCRLVSPSPISPFLAHGWIIPTATRKFPLHRDPYGPYRLPVLSLFLSLQLLNFSHQNTTFSLPWCSFLGESCLV